MCPASFGPCDGGRPTEYPASTLTTSDKDCDGLGVLDNVFEALSSVRMSPAILKLLWLPGFVDEVVVAPDAVDLCETEPEPCEATLQLCVQRDELEARVEVGRGLEGTVEDSSPNLQLWVQRELPATEPEPDFTDVEIEDRGLWSNLSWSNVFTFDKS